MTTQHDNKAPDGSKERARLFAKFATNRRTLEILFALVSVGAVLIILVPAFYRSENIFNVLRQAAILGIVALGQTVVLLVSGIDLSVGAVMSVSLVVLAELSKGDATPVVIALAIVLIMGATVGGLNGFLIAARRVPPFVATLGVAASLEGARLVYTKGVPVGHIPDAIRPIGLSGFAGIPFAFILWVALCAVFWFALSRTAYGRKVYATGTAPKVAHRAGVPVNRLLVSNYVICGVLAAIAGLVLSAFVGYIDQFVGEGYTLDSIAAAVVGGIAFVGGKGTIPGMMLGVLFVSTLLNVVILLNIDPNLQLVVRGVVIIGAVAFFALREGREAVAKGA